ncbi:hypothetical protein A3Q56_04410 [Intoshia linei]|uniref:Uncharacterized protein n=1 Tax=Intoshia linei TaxID=1819745 RepID=A0A177B0R9_9BILA|nr:hypothetical protein A3Q56_04410 [Intoshia linei]
MNIFLGLMLFFVCDITLLCMDTIDDMPNINSLQDANEIDFSRRQKAKNNANKKWSKTMKLIKKVLSYLRKEFVKTNVHHFIVLESNTTDYNTDTSKQGKNIDEVTSNEQIHHVTDQYSIDKNNVKYSYVNNDL